MNRKSICRFLVVAIVLDCLLGCSSSKLLTRDDFSKFETLTILAVPQSNTIQVFDRTKTREKFYAGQYQGALAMLIGELLVTGISTYKINTNLGGDVNELRTILRAYPFKMILKDELQKIDSNSYQVIPLNETPVGLRNILSKAKSASYLKKNIDDIAKERNNLKTIVFIEFAHGLFVRGGVTEPGIGIVSDMVVFDIVSNKTVFKKTTTSADIDYRTASGTVDELIVNNGQLYRDGFKKAAKFIAERVAFDIGGYLSK